MVVVIQEETGDTSTVIKNVDNEVLVRHFCLEAETRKLMSWCDTNRKRGTDVNERIESANVLQKKGNEASKDLKWSIATWLYLAALHQVDFSQKDASMMATEGGDALIVKDKVNGVTLLILLNLTLSFLKTGDDYNSDRCATLALWYSDRRNKTKLLAKDPVRAKLLFRRGSARYALSKKNEKSVNKSVTDGLLLSALNDLQEASLLEKDIGTIGDTTASLLSEVKLSLEKAGVIVEEGATCMEDAMQSDDWMGGSGKKSSQPAMVTANDVGLAIDKEIEDRIDQRRKEHVAWDVWPQLKQKLRKNVKAADWSKVPQKCMFLLIIEALLVYFNAPGSEHITIFSAVVPLVMIVLRPLMSVVVEEDNEDVLVMQEMRKMAVRTQGTDYAKQTKNKKKD